MKSWKTELGALALGLLTALSARTATTDAAWVGLDERLLQHQGQAVRLGDLLPGDWTHARLHRGPHPLVTCYLPGCVRGPLQLVELRGAATGPAIYVAWPAHAPEILDEPAADLLPGSLVQLGAPRS